MGKKKKKSGTSAGGKTRQKNAQAQNQSPNSDSMEESLQQRSRFATEHLKHLEVLYREGLNLEEDILEEGELQDEELQGALDELETMQAVRSAAEYISEEKFTAASWEKNETAEIFRPITGVEGKTELPEALRFADGTTAVKNSRKKPEQAGSIQEELSAQKSAKKEIVSAGTGDNEMQPAERLSEGIALETLTDANITLRELDEAGITADRFLAEEAFSGEDLSEKFLSNAGVPVDGFPLAGSEFGHENVTKRNVPGYENTAAECATGYGNVSAEDGAGYENALAEGASVYGDMSAEDGAVYGNASAEGKAGYENALAEGASVHGDTPAEDGTGYRTVSAEGMSDQRETTEEGGPNYGDTVAGNVYGYGDTTAAGMSEDSDLSDECAGGNSATTAVAESGQPPAEAEGGDGNGSDGRQDDRRTSGLSRKTGMIQIAVFFIALFGISIVGLCMPLRPTESQIEKRTLTEFPEFTWESFLSGDYTDQISIWYADTFPFRETLLSWYTDFKKLFGIQGDEVYIGDVIVADDIPDIPDEDETTTLATDTDASETDATPEETTTEMPTDTTTEAPSETITEAPTETATEEPTETDTEVQTTSGSSDSTVGGEQIGSVYIYGDQAFSVYGFSLERSDNYAKMISLAAEELAGKATVYNILVPLSYGIQLDSSVWESMGWSDEEKAIKYMYSQMSGDVKTVSVYQALLDHKDEYIYFRTDHHWTALGAYYAYQCFAGVKGITANALDSFETMTFENYLGSLYSQSNESEPLANNPDTITAYVPRGTNKMTITQKDGSILDWRVIYDVTSWRSDSKYSCFIGGDNPFSVIENPEITDGSSVLLVKESFGNAFAPFLVDHYQYVYIIDFRYYSGHLEEVVDTYGIQDVIFMNNLNSAGGSLQNYLQAFIEPEETETGQ